jgi:hypothetical protein
MRATLIGLSVLWAAACADVAAAACSPACDLNGDGLRATVQDYAVFLGAFGTKQGDAKFVAAADLDGNRSVTVADFGLLNKFCPLGGDEK